MMNILDRFLEYARIPSASDEESSSFPSTKKQLKVCELLEKQLKEAGLTDVRSDGRGYVYAKLPANTNKKLPAVGFIAHVDTSPEMSDADITPRVVDYKGGDIVLNEKLNIVMTEKDFPNLKNYVNEHLVVTDGTTLLGADDKAGVAEIMDAVIRLKESGREHGDVLVGFTPDEEIGRGADLFDIPSFGADFAYTVDGGALGEIEYENFNAAAAFINITGVSIHPGTAKNKMINALTVAREIDTLVPAWERPEHTEKYEGFFHMTNMSGGVENAKMKYIIRDHDREKFEEKKVRMQRIVDYVNQKYGRTVAECTITDTYYNMRELVEKAPHIIDRAVNAMEKCGVKPIIMPIRGGTDGARLSYMGLLCPNICTGGENFHGKYEFVSVERMEKISDIIIEMLTAQ
ncbi:MAG: peptidase T [Clostridia bacterium]|nr:peptidase T [Clostridia bacterium]